MKLSLQTDYALRTLIYLAGNGRRATAGEVAEFFQISGFHVAKVIHQLVRLGMVRGVRGSGGGIELTRDPHNLSVGEVIVAFEGSMAPLDCVDHEATCVIQPRCGLRGVLAEGRRRMLDYFHQVQLSDVVRLDGQLREFLPLIELRPGLQSKRGTQSSEDSAVVGRQRKSPTKTTKSRTPRGSRKRKQS